MNDRFRSRTQWSAWRIALLAIVACGQPALANPEALELVKTIPLKGAVVGIEIPGDIDDLFYDKVRERLYACCGDGVLAVIQRKEADRYEVVERISTGKLARTCLFDAERGRLYVPVPRQTDGTSPDLRVFQAKP